MPTSVKKKKKNGAMIMKQGNMGDHHHLHHLHHSQQMQQQQHQQMHSHQQQLHQQTMQQQQPSSFADKASMMFGGVGAAGLEVPNQHQYMNLSRSAGGHHNNNYSGNNNNKWHTSSYQTERNSKKLQLERSLEKYQQKQQHNLSGQQHSRQGQHRANNYLVDSSSSSNAHNMSDSASQTGRFRHSSSNQSAQQRDASRNGGAADGDADDDFDGVFVVNPSTASKGGSKHANVFNNKLVKQMLMPPDVDDEGSSSSLALPHLNNKGNSTTMQQSQQKKMGGIPANKMIGSTHPWGGPNSRALHQYQQQSSYNHMQNVYLKQMQQLPKEIFNKQNPRDIERYFKKRNRRELGGTSGNQQLRGFAGADHQQPDDSHSYSTPPEDYSSSQHHHHHQYYASSCSPQEDQAGYGGGRRRPASRGHHQKQGKKTHAMMLKKNLNNINRMKHFSRTQQKPYGGDRNGGATGGAYNILLQHSSGTKQKLSFSNTMEHKKSALKPDANRSKSKLLQRNYTQDPDYRKQMKTLNKTAQIIVPGSHHKANKLSYSDNNLADDEPAMLQQRNKKRKSVPPQANDEALQKKLDAESKGSVKGNMLHQLDVYGLSSKYNCSDSEDNYEDSSDDDFDNEKYGDNQMQQHQQQEDKRAQYQQVTQQQNIKPRGGAEQSEQNSNVLNNCQSEYNPKSKGRWNQPSPYSRAINEYELDMSNINNQNASISCNVTEHGTRRKKQEEKQKQKALKQGDVLCMEAMMPQQFKQRFSGNLENEEQRIINQQQKLQASNAQPVAANNVNAAAATGTKQTQNNNNKLGARKSMLQVPSNSNFSDKGSVKSKKAEYQKLKIDVVHANTAGKKDGHVNTNTIPSNATSRPQSLQTTPSPNCSKKHISSGCTQPPPQPYLPKSIQTQKSVQPQHSITNSPMRPPQLSHQLSSQKPQQIIVPAGAVADRQTLAQVQQVMKKQKDLQDQAVSPYTQSQISYSDQQHYKNYYDVDYNKDGYFTKDQVQYYKNEYLSTFEQEPKPLPITQWKLGKMIGHGSFGNVYEGIDQLGRQIAVKQVPMSKIGTNQGTQQRKIRALKQEIKLLNKLNHKNIVKYLGTHEDGDHLNVFLEYVAQGSLEQHYKNYNLTESVVRKYTQQILLGLEYLHQNNIIHRDIKAANILLRDDGSCQLADFGSSKKIIEANKNDPTASFCGTPYWMAPEVVKQSGHNRFADIWSLGCTVYELIVKKPPWTENNNVVFKILRKIAKSTKPPRYPSGISAALKDFLDCCFQQDPRMRANVYELLRHPFITEKELTNVLAHQQKLQTIAEQQSNFSDASPFSQCGRGHGFFNKIDYSKANLNSRKKQLTHQLSQNTNQTSQPHYNSPAQIQPDISPYSLQSSKTMTQLQQESSFMGSALTPQNHQLHHTTSMQPIGSSNPNKSAIVSNNDQQHQLQPVAAAADSLQQYNWRDPQSMTHNASLQVAGNIDQQLQQRQQKSLSNSEGSSQQQQQQLNNNSSHVVVSVGDVAISVGNADNAANISAAGNEFQNQSAASASTLIQQQNQQHQLALRQPYLNTVTTLNNNNLIDTSPLVQPQDLMHQQQTSQAAATMVPGSHNVNVIGGVIAQASSGAPIQYQAPPQVSVPRQRPETGDSEPDDDQMAAAKRSLNVDSTGGENGGGGASGSARRIYSFAAQQDDNGVGSGLVNNHNEAGIARAAAPRIDLNNPTFSAHPLECNFTGEGATSESIDCTDPEQSNDDEEDKDDGWVNNEVGTRKITEEGDGRGQRSSNKSNGAIAGTSSLNLSPAEFYQIQAFCQNHPPIVEESKQCAGGARGNQQIGGTQEQVVVDFGLSPIVPRDFPGAPNDLERQPNFRRQSTHNEMSVKQSNRLEGDNSLDIPRTQVDKYGGNRSSYDQNADRSNQGSLSKSATGQDVNDQKSQISFGGHKNGTVKSNQSDMQSEQSIRTSGFHNRDGSSNNAATEMNEQQQVGHQAVIQNHLMMNNSNNSKDKRSQKQKEMELFRKKFNQSRAQQHQQDGSMEESKQANEKSSLQNSAAAAQNDAVNKPQNTIDKQQQQFAVDFEQIEYGTEVARQQMQQQQKQIRNDEMAHDNHNGIASSGHRRGQVMLQTPPAVEQQLGQQQMIALGGIMGNPIAGVASAHPNTNTNYPSLHQLNKLSLDNNLTDIEEDFNENESVRKQMSMTSQRQNDGGSGAGAGGCDNSLEVRRHASGLSHLSVSKSSVKGGDHLPISQQVLLIKDQKVVGADEERKGNNNSFVVPVSSSPDQQQTPENNVMKVMTPEQLQERQSSSNNDYSNLHLSQVQQSPHLLGNSFGSHQSVSTPQTSQIQHCKTAEQQSAKKRKQVEDQIMKEIEKATKQNKKQKNLQSTASVACQQLIANSEQQQQQLQHQVEKREEQQQQQVVHVSQRMVKHPKKQFKVPKIFVGDSNKTVSALAANEIINNSNQSMSNNGDDSLSNKGGSSAHHQDMPQRVNFHPSNIKFKSENCVVANQKNLSNKIMMDQQYLPQNQANPQPQQFDNVSSQVSQLQRDQEESKNEAVVVQVDPAQQAVLEAIQAQIQKKKQGVELHASISKEDIDKSSNSSSSDDDSSSSSSYQSPQIDSDELAILDEEDQLKQQKRQSGSVQMYFSEQ